MKTSKDTRPHVYSPFPSVEVPFHIPDSKVHGANMGPTWVLSAPDRPHLVPMNLALRDHCLWPRPLGRVSLSGQPDQHRRLSRIIAAQCSNSCVNPLHLQDL